MAIVMVLASAPANVRPAIATPTATPVLMFRSIGSLLCASRKTCLCYEGDSCKRLANSAIRRDEIASR
jgi:hypothetical protein